MLYLEYSIRDTLLNFKFGNNTGSGTSIISYNKTVEILNFRNRRLGVATSSAKDIDSQLDFDILLGDFFEHFAGKSIIPNSKLYNKITFNSD